MNDLNMLKLKNLLLDKEFCISNANRDLDLGGWTMGWDHQMLEINSEINELIKEIEKENSRKSTPPPGSKRSVADINESNIMINRG
jgi:hypothetical protein